MAPTNRRTLVLVALCAAAALTLALGIAPRAAAAYDVTVSDTATAQGSIDLDGVFAPTGDDAVLNAGDANTQLAGGDLTIVTAGSGTDPEQPGILRVAQRLAGAGTLWLRPDADLDVTASITVGTLVLDGSGEVTGVVSDPRPDRGGLYKTGSGAVHLTADNDYTGPTTLNRGELEVDGDQPGSEILLDGGILSGTGAVGPVSQVADRPSIVAPGGAAPGALTTAALALDPSTTVFLRADGPDDHDQLAVSGGVTLADATLDLTLHSSMAPGTRLTLIDNDGADAVTGAFADRPEGTAWFAGSTRLRISYAGGDGNDVVAAAVRAPSEVQLGQSEPWTTVGAPVTLRAIVTVAAEAPFPTGTMTFESDGVPIGSAPLDALGAAEITTSSLPVGTHELTATYGGDANTDPSRSISQLHEVRAASGPPPPPPERRRDDGGGSRPPGGGDDGGDRGDDTPPAADPPRVKRRGAPRVVRHGRTLVITTGLVMVCPADGRRCTAAIKLQSRKRSGRNVTIGRGSVRVAPGRTRQLTLRTDRRSAPRLARGERERVTLTVAARTGSAAPVTSRRTLRLRLARAQR
jgi:autotransporter-associated beta strand protein